MGGPHAHPGIIREIIIVDSAKVSKQRQDRHGAVYNIR
jgi:hypothetical protein